MRWRVLKVSRYINIKDAKNFEYTSYFEDGGTAEVFLTSRHLSAEELFSPFFFDESRR